MRSIRLLTVAVLAVVLALSPAQNAFAVTELKYDDCTGGTYGITGYDVYDAVRFTLSDFELTSACLLAARLWLLPQEGTVRVHVFGADEKTSLVTPFDFTGLPNDYWNDAYVPSGGVTVTDGFWIAIQFYEDSPSLGFETPSSGHSYWGNPGSWTQDDRDWAIRALVQEGPCPQAIGGVVTPVNTFAILGPWLVVLGLVGCMTIVVVVAKKRRL